MINSNSPDVLRIMEVEEFSFFFNSKKAIGPVRIVGDKESKKAML
jgi:hypothetical protein